MESATGNTLLWPFVVYGIAVISLVSVMLLLSYVLGERHREPATNDVYEGGVIADGTARVLFPVHFIAWAISIKSLGWSGYITICTFIGIFLCVFIYEWSVGAMNFGPDAKKILAAYRKKIKNNSYELVDKQSK
jgi:NADH-quinone oxidoreductase subunit A